MRTLYIVRHAKSDWGNEALKDIDRPLNERGYKDAHLISSHLKLHNLNPELFITSSAIRAISTALIFARNLNFPVEKILIKDSLYESGIKVCMEVIKTIKDEHSRAFLFGHNPTITELVNQLTGNAIDNVPTTGYAAIELATDTWKSTTKGELKQFDYPKNHYKHI